MGMVVGVFGLYLPTSVLGTWEAHAAAALAAACAGEVVKVGNWESQLPGR